jgi:hypothetical protein
MASTTCYLLEELQALPDPRRPSQNLKHRLGEVVTISLSVSGPIAINEKDVNRFGMGSWSVDIAPSFQLEEVGKKRKIEWCQGTSTITRLRDTNCYEPNR